MGCKDRPQQGRIEDDDLECWRKTTVSSGTHLCPFSRGKYNSTHFIATPAWQTFVLNPIEDVPCVAIYVTTDKKGPKRVCIQKMLTVEDIKYGIWLAALVQVL